MGSPDSSGAAEKTSPLVASLLQQGRLGIHYARYLSGRTELLSLHDRRLLSRLRVPLPQRSDAFDFPADPPIRDVRFENISPGFETYSAEYQGKRVILDVYGRSSHRGRAWKRFGDFLDGWSSCPVPALRSLEVRQQFRSWLDLCQDISPKRDYLTNLAELPGETRICFPRLIPELQSQRVVAYDTSEGKSFATLLERGDGEAPIRNRLAEAVLELALLLAVTLGDPDIHHWILQPDGRTRLALVPAMTPVPLHLHFELLQYTASALAGDQERAVRMLARLLGAGRHAPTLRDTLKSQPPHPHAVAGEMPDGVASLFELYQAARRSGIPVPDFLTFFHRQLAMAADATTEIATEDYFSEALWSVLGRITRFRLRAAFSLENTGDWMLGGGIASLSLARQMTTLLEEVTSDELTVSTEARRQAPSLQPGLTAGGVVRRFLMWGALFLGSLQAAMTASGAWQLISTLTAGVAAIFLFQLISRSET